jgi:hypothetical protein
MLHAAISDALGTDEAEEFIGAFGALSYVFFSFFFYIAV